MTYSRRSVEHLGDREQLEKGEARVLFTTWQITGDRMLTNERMEFIEKRYGRGSVVRIRQYMKQMLDGELT